MLYTQLIAIAAFVFIQTTSLSFGFVHLFAVASGSMQPTITQGSVVVVRRLERPYQVGEVISYRANPSGQVITHRIVGVHAGGYRTKGDGNALSDRRSVTNDMVVGKVIFNIPYLGYPSLLTFTSKLFLLFCVIAIVSLAHAVRVLFSAASTRGRTLGAVLACALGASALYAPPPTAAWFAASDVREVATISFAPTQPNEQIKQYTTQIEDPYNQEDPQLDHPYAWLGLEYQLAVPKKVYLDYLPAVAVLIEGNPVWYGFATPVAEFSAEHTSHQVYIAYDRSLHTNETGVSATPAVQLTLVDDLLDNSDAFLQAVRMTVYTHDQLTTLLGADTLESPDDPISWECFVRYASIESHVPINQPESQLSFALLSWIAPNATLPGSSQNIFMPHIYDLVVDHSQQHLATKPLYADFFAISVDNPYAFFAKEPLQLISFEPTDLAEPDAAPEPSDPAAPIPTILQARSLLCP